MTNSKPFILLCQLVFLLLFPGGQRYQYLTVLAYHTPGENAKYHCWPRNASAINTEPITCQGISIDWVESPPDAVYINQKFNVSYMLHADNRFYTSMFGFEGYPHIVSNSTDLRQFCSTSECPVGLAADSERFPSECCVWHANVHVCHPSETCGGMPVFCGPWVSNDQAQSTHTNADYGNIDKLFGVEMDIRRKGMNHVIAHVQLGDIQLAVQEIVNVHFCGDNQCSFGETCDAEMLCRLDCCSHQDSSFPTYAIFIIVSLFLLILVFPVVFIVCFCYRRRKLFYDESWIIDMSKIKRLDQQTPINLKDGISNVVSIHTMLLTKSIESDTASNAQRPLHSSCNNSRVSLSPQGKHHFTQTGIYEGRTVALKKLPRRQIVLTNQIRFDVMKVRALDHPNLCRFIGATVVNPTVVSEYCPKGSLRDVMLNEDIPLNWGFRLSFATDIARGMGYLHSKKLYHGRLTSNNCVIDDRWTVKIADYGLPSLRASGTLSSIPRGNATLMSVMYVAPEQRTPGLIMPSAAADVYSFSIILYEISTRINLNRTDLFVDNEARPQPPVLNKSECPCPVDYVELMKQCWDTNQGNRPSFDYVRKALHKMNPNKESPVDMMMIMMEKYSNHLEQLVVDRTQELIVEQRKTSNLLYSMLPRQVADELRHGRPAAAQSFKSATIFFSDIVGFTSLASASTPMEIVDMLNGLYSLFDDVLDTFDVYKVETIGDAYMVVSGVPQENGNKHAGEIAKMALKLIGVTEAFKIPHRPRDKLKIRAGIHSGPVVAGVVGLKMPRYCLFGDTVNTASRMESNSEAMKIQCSNETYKLLKPLDTFTLECRGEITIKGKGSMTTWWLTGLKQTMDVPLNRNTPQLPIKLSPIVQLRSRSSLSSNDAIMGGASSPNLSQSLKHPFSCSPLPTAVVSPQRSRELLPISITDYSNGDAKNLLNLDSPTDIDSTSLIVA